MNVKINNDTHQAKVIAVVNQKGGVGKTTTTMNLAASLAIMEKKSLIIDLDPQSNSSTGLGVENQNRVTSYDFILNNTDLDYASLIVSTKIPLLDIIPANMDLSGAEIELTDLPGRERCLNRALAKLQSINNYDYVFIDCPPSLGLLTLNALVAATEVLIPLQCEYFALEGLSHLEKTIALVKQNLNPSLKIKGILLTMYDSRNNLSKAISEDIRGHYKDLVYQTIIPRNIKVSEATSFGLPVILYDTQCLGAKAYVELAAEIISKED